MTERISISVTDEDYKYLNEHPEIDRSKMFREALHEKKSMESGKNPLLFMVCTIGIIMGVVLILVSLVNFLAFEIRIFLPLLGGILSFMSAYIYYNNTSKLRRVEQ